MRRERRERPSGRRRQRIGPEPVADRGDLRRAQHLARRRAAQVAPPGLGDPAHAHRADRRGRRPVALLHLPEQPEVDVDDAVAERGEEVLAVGRHLVEHPSVDEGGVGEAALRAGHGDRTAGEPGALGARQAVQRVALGHQRPAALPTRARGSAEAAKVPLGSTTMAWAWPNPESNAGASATTWPRAASPLRHVVGRLALDRDGRRPAAGPRVEAGAAPLQRPAAGGDGVGHAAAGTRTAGPRPAAGSAAGRRRPSCRTPRRARRRASPSPGTACAAAAARAPARPGARAAG